MLFTAESAMLVPVIFVEPGVSVKLKASVTLVALVIPFPVPPAGYKTIRSGEVIRHSVFISSNRVDTSTPLRTLSPSHSNDVGSDENQV